MFYSSLAQAHFSNLLTTHAVPCLLLSRVRFFATLWTVAHQAPLSMKFFR